MGKAYDKHETEETTYRTFIKGNGRKTIFLNMICFLHTKKKKKAKERVI